MKLLSPGTKLLVLGVALLGVACAAKPQFRSWVSYADQLGTGSMVDPSRGFVTDTGDIEVTMKKAPDPEPDENNPPPYPYVGIQLQFPGRQPADLSDAESIVLTYKLKGPMSMLLSQDNIAPGSEFRVGLPAAADYTAISLDWADFSQPDWVSPRSTLDRKRLTGVKFQITTPESNTAELGVRRLEFLGHEF